MPDLPVLASSSFPKPYGRPSRQLMKAAQYQRGKIALAAMHAEGIGIVTEVAMLRLDRLCRMENEMVKASVLSADRAKLICDTAAFGMASVVQRLASGY